MAKKKTTPPSKMTESFSEAPSKPEDIVRVRSDQAKLYPEPGVNLAGTKSQPTEPKVKSRKVTLTIPEGELVEGGNLRKRFDVKTSMKEAVTLRRISRGLEDDGARLKDGTQCRTGAHAIRWMLEQIGE